MKSSARLTASLAAVCSAFAIAADDVQPAETPSAAEQATTESAVVDFFKQGTFNLNMRFRYEHGDVDGLGSSNAFTLRTRLGYTTPVFEGFQGMVELEDVRAADDDEYFDAASPANGLTPIADPQDTELNQLWLSYNFSELIGTPITAKVGRQRIIFDDARFIGNVGWRQNEQTFDAAMVTAKPTDELTATYVYINEVNRIFGPDSTSTVGNVDFDSDSHLVNVAYTGLDLGKIVGFAYLLDLTDSIVGPANSSQTYGVRLDGSVPLTDDLALGYIGSFAWQSDYGPNATSYEAVYLLAEGKLKFTKTAGAFIGGGFEMLGSDDGTFAFRTPLATGHKFNGFADAFLVTPASGLHDYYVTGGLTIPEIDVKAVATYHYFTADDTSADLGQEVDLVLVKKIDDNFSVLAKAAYLDGDGPTRDTTRFSIQLDVKF